MKTLLTCNSDDHYKFVKVSLQAIPCRLLTDISLIFKEGFFGNAPPSLSMIRAIRHTVLDGQASRPESLLSSGPNLF
jgi:hypothetical protein